GMTRVFRISGAGTDVVIDGLTIANGLANDVTFNEDYGPVTLGGGILNDGGRLTVSQVTMTGNQAIAASDDSIAGAGAIANVHGGQLIVSSCTFSDNLASGLYYPGGGAIVSDGGTFGGTTVAIDHSTFTHNLVTNAAGGDSSYSGGGAIYNGTASALTVAFCTFDNNQVLGGNDLLAGRALGRAIIAEPHRLFTTPTSGAATALTISHSTFHGNLAIAGNGGYAQGDGGALFLDAGATATIDHSDFTANRARGSDVPTDAQTAGDSFGGAITNASSTLAVSNSTFSDNEAQGGSGGAGVGGGQALGGALASAPSLASVDLPPLTTIDNCRFNSNRAIGGAGDIDPNDPLLSFFGGSARGGAIDSIVGTLYLSNSQLIANEALGGAGVNGNGGNARGGGLNNEMGSTAHLAHVS